MTVLTTERGDWGRGHTDSTQLEEDNEFVQLKLDLQAKQTHADATQRHTNYLSCSSLTDSPASAHS